MFCYPLHDVLFEPLKFYFRWKQLKGCGCIQQCNRDVVDSSAQRGASFTFCCIGWELCHICGGALRTYVIELVSEPAGCCKCLGCHSVQRCYSTMLFWPSLVASYDSLQDGTHVALLMPLICTTVQQGLGRQLSSAWRAIAFQPHRSGMWFCSLGDTCKVCCFVFGEVDKSLQNWFLCYCLFIHAIHCR